MKKALLICMCTGLIGCSSVGKPIPYGLQRTMPGPDEFRKGWEDGCESGIAATGSTFYKSYYSYKQDPLMTTNRMYYQAWKNAFSYCCNYVLKWDHVPIDEPENTDPNQ